jgi:uncharacterized protein
MFRKYIALAALAALSLSSVACVEATAEEQGSEVEETTTQDLVSRSANFETFQGLDGRFYFHLVAGNGANVLRSQGYTALASAENGVSSVLDNGNDKRNFEVLEANDGSFYFNVKAANGAIVGTSQLYTAKSSAERAARSVQALVRIAQQESKTYAAPKKEQFELFSGEDGKSYFRLRAGNGEVLLSSQAYTAKTSAKKGIDSVKENGSEAASFKVFEAWDGGWAISLVATNGEVIARGESYASKSNATRAVNRITEILGTDSVATAE